MLSSRGEVLIHNILSDASIKFKEEFVFEGLNSENGRALRFDFAVFDDEDNLECLIEYQGKQHYEPSTKFGGKRGFYQQQHNDDKKRRFCALNGIKLIEIPYTDENKLNYDYLIDLIGLL